MAYREVRLATEKCPGCNAELPKGTELCPACGNPVDISRFAELELKVKPDLRKARIFLGVLTGLGMVGLAMRAGSGAGTGAIVGEGIGVAIFGACFLAAFWAPLGSSIAAMAAFLLNVGVDIGAGKIGALFDGVFLKVIFLVLLVSGIRAGYRVRDLRGQWRKRDRTIGAVVLVGSAVLGVLLGLRVSR